jgi:hypothetical protein
MTSEDAVLILDGYTDTVWIYRKNGDKWRLCRAFVNVAGDKTNRESKTRRFVS